MNRKYLVLTTLALTLMLSACGGKKASASQSTVDESFGSVTSMQEMTVVLEDNGILPDEVVVEAGVVAAAPDEVGESEIGGDIPEPQGNSENVENQAETQDDRDETKTESQPTTSGNTSTAPAASSAPSTAPSASSAPTTAPGGTQGSSGTDSSNGEVTYEAYQAMDGTQQKEFYDSFDSVEAFFAWYNAAKEKYEAEHPAIEIGGDGVVDVGGLGG